MRQAHLCRASLVNGGPPPQPVAYGNELAGVVLDGSMDSVERIDALLERLHLRYAPTAESLDATPGGETLVILLAVALGLAIERATNLEIEWLDWENAAPRHPPDHPLPRERWARLVGIFANSSLAPLGLIEAALFEGDRSMTCAAYAERWIQRAQGVARTEVERIDWNARCREFLGALAAGIEPPGGLTHFNALRETRPDFTSQSLQRIDALLREIRQRDRPDYAAWVNTPASQNLIRMLAYYVAMCTARVGQLPIKWLNFQELTAQVPDIEFQFETTCACLLDNRLFFPLGLITEILLQPSPQRTVAGWSSGVLAQATNRMISIRRGVRAGSQDAAIPLAWEEAVGAAGHCAAHSLFMVEGGQTLAPLVLAPRGDKRLFTAFGLNADEAAYEQSARKLAYNPDGCPWQVRSTDGYANLPTGRTDAITIELRCYGGGLLSRRKPLSLVIACPYRNASSSEGFAIHSPKLLECSAPAAMQASLFEHFYRGIDGFRLDPAATTFTWNRYLDESV
ncbi:hypothetical protein [Ramlibacter sp.]|uniref:hypothetical protein n=1 Tax=Ramlibacter sp. TaxID=1917967 RepID=UPI0035B11C76